MRGRVSWAWSPNCRDGTQLWGSIGSALCKATHELEKGLEFAQVAKEGRQAGKILGALLGSVCATNDYGSNPP